MYFTMEKRDVHLLGWLPFFMRVVLRSKPWHDMYFVPSRTIPLTRSIYDLMPSICEVVQVVVSILFHTVHGSEIPNNHLGCIKPCK